MSIDWGALGTVAAVSAAFGVGIVVVFSLGLLGLSAAEGRTAADADGTAAAGARTTGLSRGAGLALAGLAGAVCLAAVAYGVYLIAA